MERKADMEIQSRAVMIRQEGVSEIQLERFMEAINRLARLPLRAEQVHIRSMYLCSDRLCPQDWGRFSEAALRQVCRLVVGQSVIAGHDRSRLPIARFFHAEVVQREDDPFDEEGRPVRWVRAWFYWLRETSGSRDLLLNIDGGIYREVSISWRYRRATCSICGEPIQSCPHTPGRFYEGRRCTFLIEDVAEVLEGSIVYKGAEPRTRFEGSHSEGARRAGLADGENGQGFFQPLRVYLERELRALARQPRSVRSLLVLSDQAEEATGLLWLGKALGLRVQGRWLGPAGLSPIFSGGIDWKSAEVEEGEAAQWDLIWVRLSALDRMDPACSWWKRLGQRARFCVWQGPAGAQRGKLRQELLEQWLPSPPWQLRTVGEPADDEAVELVREAS